MGVTEALVMFSEATGFLRDLSPGSHCPRIRTEIFFNLLPFSQSARKEFYQWGWKQLCVVCSNLSNCYFCVQKGCLLPPIRSGASRKACMLVSFLLEPPASFLSWRLNENDCRWASLQYNWCNSQLKATTSPLPFPSQIPTCWLLVTISRTK